MSDKESPLHQNEIMVWCTIHSKYTNMCYMGGAYIDRKDKNRSEEDMAKCVCCQGRHRWLNYFDRVNKIQAEYEESMKIPPDQCLRVFPTEKRVDSDPYPFCKVVLVSSLKLIPIIKH